MKNKCLFYISLLLLSQFVYSQNAFENSKTIYEHLKNNKIELLLENRNLTWIDSENTKEYWNKLENFSRFLNDPFNKGLQPIDVSEILQILQSATVQVAESEYGEKSENIFGISEIKGLLDSFKGVDSKTTSKSYSSGYSFTTKVIDGASKFLVNRTKRELSLTFYEHFYNKLNNPLYYRLNNDSIKVYLKDVLPNSYMLFDTKQIFETPSFGQTWTTAFQNDISKLPFSIVDVFKKDQSFQKDALGRYAMILMEGLNKIENGNHPIDIIENLASEYNEFSKYSVDAHIGLLNLISQNCTKVDETDRKWINLVEFNKLNKEEKKYFTALIYQQGIQEGVFKPSNQKQSEINISIDNENYNILYQGIKDIQGELINMYNKIETAKGTEQNQMDFINYSKLFINSINITYQTVLNVKQENYYESVFYDKYFPISKDVINFYDGINNSNYGSCLLSSVNFLNHLSHQNDNKRFIQDFTYYGNFLVDIVFASTHEGIDIENIINKYALPVTSYRIKRIFRNSIDINAYPGVYFGYEFSNSKSPNFGISAPVGFAFSWSKTHENEKYATSHSIFISALDFGAPFSYRFEHDGAEGLPENIKWEQLFSPGIFYVYGFKNSPLSITTGLQFTPLLRKIETQNILDTENVLRLSLGLNVDIPIINLYKKSR